MSLGYIRFAENPENREILRRINEARAAAFYGAWRGLIDGLADTAAAIAERIARLQRAGELRAELRRLDDRALRDIGLSRADVEALEAGRIPEQVAEGIAAEPRQPRGETPPADRPRPAARPAIRPLPAPERSRRDAA